ncbi:hypothetical protein [Hymenobacter weizhouensis]|uniref:hypothetical protein n=1 Tax=Hymenobacter sp. YIM 151500-1 TaxID=2987689 RepID=UPI0022280529|nr:hypothetical protein [Hymenobacter sp. YIM 151500-1]UYZ65123.1 hypothetical protein OIS53_09790 [Hymenobacter sp. YIM 151500-1]
MYPSILPARLLQLTSLLALATTLLACQQDEETPSTGLVGRWQLTNRQCFCAPGPVPDETVIFTEKEYFFYENGQLARQGTYTMGAGKICGLSVQEGLLNLTPASTNPPALTSATPTANATTLTLDFGRACDAPFNTYRRLK